MIKKLAESPCFEAGDKTHLREILHPTNDGLDTNFSIAHAYLEVGEFSLPHRLIKSSETYHILSGQGEIWVDGTPVTVAVGDTYYIAPNQLQSVRNTGQECLAFLCIVSPPWTADDEIVYVD